MLYKSRYIIIILSISDTCKYANQCLVYTNRPLSADVGGIGLILLALVIHGVLAFVLLVLIDCGMFRNIAHRMACIRWRKQYRFRPGTHISVLNERLRVRTSSHMGLQVRAWLISAAPTLSIFLLFPFVGGRGGG